MTAATITTRFSTALPTIEVVQLTVTDGETYTSEKFSSVYHAVASGNEDVDAHINVVTDGTATVTINYASASDKLVTLILFGN